jgi:hypothetical protein
VKKRRFDGAGFGAGDAVQAATARTAPAMTGAAVMITRRLGPWLDDPGLAGTLSPPFGENDHVRGGAAQEV